MLYVTLFTYFMEINRKHVRHKMAEGCKHGSSASMMKKKRKFKHNISRSGRGNEFNNDNMATVCVRGIYCSKNSGK